MCMYVLQMFIIIFCCCMHSLGEFVQKKKQNSWHELKAIIYFFAEFEFIFSSLLLVIVFFSIRKKYKVYTWMLSKWFLIEWLITCLRVVMTGFWAKLPWKWRFKWIISIDRNIFKSSKKFEFPLDLRPNWLLKTFKNLKKPLNT